MKKDLGNAMESDRCSSTDVECEAVDAGIIPFMRNRYRSYRNWKKRRDHRKKWRKTLETMVAFYGNFVKEGDLCFDIGANMGNRTEAFLALGAVVLAVEPQEKCAAILRQKFGDNPNFNLVDKALDETEGEKEFFVSNAHTLSSFSTDWIHHAKKLGTFDGCAWNQKTIVPTTTLDILIDKYGCPDFCKIDVEGGEYDVLRGLSQPIGVVSLEYTIGIIEPTIRCIGHLSGLGEVRFNYSEGESMRLAMPNWVEADEIKGIIANLSDKILFGDIYAKFNRHSPETCEQ